MVHLIVSALLATNPPVLTSPNRLQLGTLYPGAIAEASLMVLKPGTDPNIKFGVTVPKFVKLLKTEVRHQKISPGDFVCGSAFLAIDTATPGEFRGEVVVTLGSKVGRIPVEVTIRPRKPGLTRLLVVGTPLNRYWYLDRSPFATWTDLARDAGFDVSYLLVDDTRPTLRDLDLAGYDCVLLSADSFSCQTPADVKRVRAYAEAGGRVVVATNHYYHATVPKANEVLDGYGVRLKDEEAPVDGVNHVLLGKRYLAPELSLIGVEVVRFFRGSPVEVTDPKRARVVVGAVGTGKAGDGFVAVAKAGKGEVVVLGYSLWDKWVSREWAGDTDNAKLFRWLIRLPRPI